MHQTFRFWNTWYNNKLIIKTPTFSFFSFHKHSTKHRFNFNHDMIEFALVKVLVIDVCNDCHVCCWVYTRGFFEFSCLFLNFAKSNHLVLSSECKSAENIWCCFRELYDSDNWTISVFASIILDSHGFFFRNFKWKRHQVRPITDTFTQQHVFFLSKICLKCRDYRRNGSIFKKKTQHKESFLL